MGIKEIARARINQFVCSEHWGIVPRGCGVTFDSARGGQPMMNEEAEGTPIGAWQGSEPSKVLTDSDG